MILHYCVLYNNNSLKSHHLFRALRANERNAALQANIFIFTQEIATFFISLPQGENLNNPQTRKYDNCRLSLHHQAEVSSRFKTFVISVVS